MTSIKSLPGACLDIIQLDGILLDERRWNEWLDLYSPDCIFWLPMWGDEDTLNHDTHSGLSHIFYDSRKGLEDRIVRIRSGKSPATTPLPRTAHLVTNIRPSTEVPEACSARATWSCHVFFPRNQTQHVFFGRSEYQLQEEGGSWKIKSKKISLLNDLIPGLLDIYCV